MLIVLLSFIGIYYIIYKNYKSRDFILLSILMVLFYNNQLNFVTTYFEYLQNVGHLMAENEFFNSIINPTGEGRIYDDEMRFNDILFDNIDFSYDRNNKIYENFSLKINPNEKILLSEEFGSGKGAIAKLLMKFYKPSKGRILIDGKNISDINTGLLRKRIIYINQNCALFDDTIYNNIKYGNNIDESNVIKLMKKYDLYDNFEGIIHLKVNDHISGGIKKLIILLRGLLKTDYDTIILDEPTENLDYNTKVKVIRMINDLTRDKTLILISHDDICKNIVSRVVDI